VDYNSWQGVKKVIGKYGINLFIALLKTLFFTIFSVVLVSLIHFEVIKVSTSIQFVLIFSLILLNIFLYFYFLRRLHKGPKSVEDIMKDGYCFSGLVVDYKDIGNQRYVAIVEYQNENGKTVKVEASELQKEFVDYLKGKYVPVYVDKNNSRNYFVDTYPVIDIYLRNRR
jgi:hypothetical protein